MILLEVAVEVEVVPTNANTGYTAVLCTIILLFLDSIVYIYIHPGFLAFFFKIR